MSHTTTRRQLLRWMALGSAGALLAACSQPSPPAAQPPAAAPAAKAAAPLPAKPVDPGDQLYDVAKKEGKVVWWETMDRAQAEKFIKGFEKRYPGVQVELFVGTTTDLRTRALAEARAGSITFDVTKPGGAAGNFPAYKDNGLVTDNAELMEAAGIKREHQFEGTYNPEWIVYGAAYNPTLVKKEELPRRWEGFLEPKWKGKLAVESRLNLFVYATPHWGGEQKVVEYLKKLKDQTPRLNEGDIATNKLLVAGEFPVLLGAYLQNYARYAPEKAPWDYAPLDEVYVAAGGPGYTIPEKAPHPNAAKLFLSWLVGPEGRDIDEERFAGNPLPGSGTGPSKFLQERNITIKLTPRSYTDDFSKYQKMYLEALGLPVT